MHRRQAVWARTTWRRRRTRQGANLGPSHTPKAAARRNADMAWSKYVRARDGACRRCGTGYDLQAAHIIRRAWNATRTDERNGVALCSVCHHWFDVTATGDERTEMVEQWITHDVWTELYLTANQSLRRADRYTKEFWDSETKRLKALLNDLLEEQGRYP